MNFNPQPNVLMVYRGISSGSVTSAVLSGFGFSRLEGKLPGWEGMELQVGMTCQMPGTMIPVLGEADLQIRIIGIKRKNLKLKYVFKICGLLLPGGLNFYNKVRCEKLT